MPLRIEPMAARAFARFCVDADIDTLLNLWVPLMELDVQESTLIATIQWTADSTVELKFPNQVPSRIEWKLLNSGKAVEVGSDTISPGSIRQMMNRLHRGRT